MLVKYVRIVNMIINGNVAAANGWLMMLRVMWFLKQINTDSRNAAVDPR